MKSLQEILNGGNIQPLNLDSNILANDSQSRASILNQPAGRSKADTLATDADRLKSNWTPDILTGMADADTPYLKSQEIDGSRVNATREVTSPNAYDYDAVEGYHYGKNGELYNITPKEEIAKSKWKTGQLQQVADIVGKPIDQITNQDISDVSNMQTIQKVADLARTKEDAGTERWMAPFIPNAEPVNLTGNTVDEYGQKQYIPLDIPIQSNLYQGLASGSNRSMASLGNNAGENVTLTHSVDPRMNLTPDKARSNIHGSDVTNQNDGMSTWDQYLALEAKRKGEAGQSVGGRLKNTVAAAASKFGEGIVQTIDLPFEAAQWAYDKATGQDFDWSNAGLYSDKKIAEVTQKVTGYDANTTQKLGQRAMNAIGEAIDKGDWREVGKTLGDAITTPEFYGEVVGFLGSLILPGSVAKKSVQAVKGVNKAVKELIKKNPRLKMADAVAEVEKNAGVGYKISKILASNTGYVNYAEQVARESEAEYKKLYGEEMPAGRRAGAFLTGLVSGKIDGYMGKGIMLGKDPVAKMIRKAIGEATPKVQKSMIRQIAEATGLSTVKVAGTMAEEGMTEGVQGALEIGAGQYNSDKKGVLDILTDKENIKNYGSQALLGAAGGAQMNIGAQGMEQAGVITHEAKSKLDTKISDIKAKKAGEKTSVEIQSDHAQNIEDSFTKMDERIKTGDIDGAIDMLENATYSMHKLTNEKDKASVMGKIKEASKRLVDKANKEADKRAAMTDDELIALGSENLEETKLLPRLKRTLIRNMTDDGKILNKDIMETRRQAATMGVPLYKIDNMIEEMKLENSGETETETAFHKAISASKRVKGAENKKAQQDIAVQSVTTEESNIQKIEDKVASMKKEIEAKATKLAKNGGVDRSSMLDTIEKQYADKTEMIDQRYVKTDGKTATSEPDQKVEVSYKEVVDEIRRDKKQENHDPIGVYATIKSKSESVKRMRRSANLSNLKLKNEEKISKRLTTVKNKLKSKELSDIERVKLIQEKAELENTSTEHSYTADKKELQQRRKEMTAAKKKLASAEAGLKKAKKGGKAEISLKKKIAGLKKEIGTLHNRTNTLSADLRTRDERTDKEKFVDKAKGKIKTVNKNIKSKTKDIAKLLAELKGENDTDTESTNSPGSEKEGSKVNGSPKNKISSAEDVLAMLHEDESIDRSSIEYGKVADEAEQIIEDVKLLNEAKEEYKQYAKAIIAKERREEAKQAVEAGKISKEEALKAIRSEEIRDEDISVDPEDVKNIEDEISDSKIEELESIADQKKKVIEALLGMDKKESKKKKKKSVHQDIAVNIKLSESMARVSQISREVDLLLVERYDAMQSGDKKAQADLTEKIDKLKAEQEDIRSVMTSKVRTKNQIENNYGTWITLYDNDKAAMPDNKAIMPNEIVELNGKPSYTSAVDLSAPENESLKIYIDKQIERLDGQIRNTNGKQKGLHRELYIFGSDEKNGHSAAAMHQMMQDPATLLIYKKTEEVPEGYKIKGAHVGSEFMTIDPNMMLAIDVTLENYAITRMSEMMKNDDDTIRKILGLQDSDKVTAAMRREVGQGAALKYLAKDLGNEVMSNMGIRITDTAGDQGQAMVATLGYKVIQLGMAKGYLQDELHRVKKTIMQEMMKKTSLETSSGEDAQDSLYVRLSKQMKERDNIMALKEDEERAKYIEALSVEKQDRGPLMAPPMAEKKRKVKNTFVATNANAATVAVMNKMEQTEYNVDIEATNELLKLEDENKEALYKNLGIHEVELDENGEVDIDNLPPELAKMDKTTRDSAIAASDEMKNALTDLREMRDNIANGQSNRMWFKWFLSKNGRLFMDSNTINPQVNKVHRFVVTAKASNTNISISDKKTMNIFAIAIAQAFGVGIDKTITETNVAVGQKLMNMKQSELDALVTEMVNGGEPKLSIPGSEVKLEAEHIAHLLSAVENIKKYQAGKKNGKFTSTLVFETDGITNGISIKLMQFADVTNLSKWLAKSGILIDGATVDGKKVKIDKNTKKVSYNDYIHGEKEMQLDNYQELVSQVKTPTEEKIQALNEQDGNKYIHQASFNAVAPLLPEMAENGVISKAAREIVKYPLMIFGYGGSLETIKRNIGNDMMEKVPMEMIKGYDEYIASGKKVKTKAYLMAEYIAGKENVGKLIKAMKERDFETIKISEFRDGGLFKTTDAKYMTIADYYGNQLAMLYGQQVADIMEKTFEPLIESNRIITNGFKAMFAMYKKAYETEAKRIEDNQGRELTQRQKEELMLSLSDIFPQIQSPLAKAGEDSGIEIVTKKEVALKSKIGTTAQAKINASKAKDGAQQRTIPITVRELEAAISSGAVLPTHWQDGSMIIGVLKNWRMTEVHDAIVIGVGQSGAVLDYNKNFYDVTKNYNVYEEVEESIRRAMSYMSQEEIDAIDREHMTIHGDSKNPSKKIIPQKDKNEVEKDETEYISIQDTMKEIMDATKRNNIAKNKLFSKNMVISQMPLTGEQSYYVSGEEQVNYDGNTPEPEVGINERDISSVKSPKETVAAIMKRDAIHKMAVLEASITKLADDGQLSTVTMSLSDSENSKLEEGGLKSRFMNMIMTAYESGNDLKDKLPAEYKGESQYKRQDAAKILEEFSHRLEGEGKGIYSTEDVEKANLNGKEVNIQEQDDKTTNSAGIDANTKSNIERQIEANAARKDANPFGCKK